MPNFLNTRSLEERLASKVISRVVTDGVALTNAITEAVKFADLTRQQTIHLCAILQDYGMVYNGDPRSYFQSSDDMGKDVPNPEAGYQVYAGNKSSIKTASLDKIFDTIVELRKKGFKDEEISAFNPDLSDILAAIDEADEKLTKVSTDLNNRLQTPQQAPVEELEEQPAAEPEMELAAMSVRGKIVQAQAADVEVEEPTKENISKALEDANAPAPEEGGGELAMADEGADLGADGGDLGGADEEIDLGGDDVLGGGGDVNATVRPTPSDLETRISDAPEWEVENILSIQSAENFYNNLRKDLEAVVFNENIVLSKESLKSYDGIRSKIDEQLDKIKEAQKEKKKLEEKETDLSEEFDGGEAGGELDMADESLGDLPPIPGEESPEGEAPTEEIVAEEGQENPYGKRNPN